MKKIFFTPGPSELYPTVSQHLQTALDLQISSISHRGSTFKNIYEKTIAELRNLLSIPRDYHIFFFASANEIWERLIQNCVREKSFHLVNGNFSERYFKYALALGKHPEKHEVNFGEGFSLGTIKVPDSAELIACIANETSSGVQISPGIYYDLKASHPDKLVVLDCVSAFPHYNLELAKIDAAYFSVQKGFGLPAGLGVGILSPAVLERSFKLKEEGISVGSYHAFPTMLEKAQAYQNVDTPNVLSIWLLGKIVEDMLEKGIDKIRSEGKKKAEMIYSFLDSHNRFSAFINEPKNRSETVVVADVGEAALQIVKEMESKGFQIGQGYGSWKNKQLRIANFPATSPEQMAEMLSHLPQ